MVFLSLGLRALVNVEALNMVESVGNIVRRRKAAIVYKRDGEYVVRWVPAVSGESMAHSYQAMLAKIALQRGLPVCEYCAKEEFVKHCDTNVFGSLPWETKLAQVAQKPPANTVKFMIDFERTIVENCIVEDVGGFLFAGKIPVKRTSRFMTGYMIPAMDAIEKAVIDTQFQVRHAPTASQKWRQAQMPYNVEVASAVYAWSFYLDVSGIGCTSMVERVCLSIYDRVRRVEAAIDALALMLDQRLFGAKLSRFNPVVGYEVIVATVSKNMPFTVSPPAMGKRFIIDTVERALRYTGFVGDEVKVLIWAGPEADKEINTLINEAVSKASGADKVSVKECKGIYELLGEAKEVAVKWLREIETEAR